MRKGEKNVEVSRIQVFARCRPLNSIERKQDSLSVVEVIPKEKKVAVKDRNKEFTFDKVFQPDIKQIDVYKSVAEPLIQEVLKGFNCTILAYGQTGTGKTYTMEGERNNAQCSWEDDPGAGIIPRSLHQLFEELNKGENVEFSVRVSFLELYNEELLDLLSSKDDLTRLRIYENASKKGSLQQDTKMTAKQSRGVGSVHIDGLEEVVVNSKDEVYAILEKGTARRQTASTLLNASSSRSHTVFSVTVHIKENTNDGEELVKTGKLNLVDLAGSECVGRSGCVNQRFREASNINMSLLTLGRVITALIENQPHVPYRESKLTRLLQDSLGGHTKTSFIATISPAQCNLEETMSTLDYATKAKSITNKPIINEKMTKRALIRELTEEIERLRKDLFALRNGEGYFVDAQNYAQMEKSITEKEEQIKLMEEEYEALKQHNRDIEQSLTFKKEELHKKTKEHEETVSKLTNISETLCNTEKVLSKTALDRDEKAYLLNIHRNKEKQLFEQNHELYHVVGESTGDVNKLHMKVERKQKVELTNEERCKQFQQVCHKQFAYLDDLVNSLKHGQDSKLCNLEESLDDFVAGFVNCFQQTTDILSNIVSEQSRALNDLSTKLSNESAEHEKMSNSLLENLNLKKNALVADQEIFCSKNLPSFEEKFSSMVVEMKNWFHSSHDCMRQKVKNLRNQLNINVEKNSKVIKDVSSNIDNFIQHHSSLLVSLKKESQVISSLESKRNEKMDQIYALLEEVKEINAQGRKEFSLLEETYQVMEESVPSLETTKKSLQTHLEASEEEFASSLVALDDITSVKTNEFTSQLDSLANLHNSETSEITIFIKNIQQKQESVLKMIETEVVANEVVAKGNYESKKSHLKEVQGSLSDGIKGDILNLEDRKSCILKTVSDAETIIKDSKQDLQKASQLLSKEILQRDLEIEKFISEDLEKDLPTGTTPQRKTYYYSKELIQLSPDEEKLRILRQFRGEHTDKAVTVTLPMDSSFDESDEFKSPSPMNDGFSELTAVNIAESVHNASFNNGDEYSTDCETLSNASSTSDLSVTGLKNKENFKAFLKPSLNKPRVKNTKKKLVESCIPTPTQRKPLSSKNPAALA